MAAYLISGEAGTGTIVVPEGMAGSFAIEAASAWISRDGFGRWDEMDEGEYHEAGVIEDTPNYFEAVCFNGYLVATRITTPYPKEER